MKKNCNITKDLLPLYIEELCSRDSCQYVEEHLAECEECKKTYEYLKYTDLCITATEKKEINALKKLEKYIKNHFLFLVAMITYILILMFTTLYVYPPYYYLLMPPTMLAIGFTFRHNILRPMPKSFDIQLVIQGILLIYTIVLMFYTMCNINPDGYTLGIPTYKLGPLLDAQFKVTIGISLFFLISHLYQVGSQKKQYDIRWNLAILCIFINLAYDSTLYGMDSLDTLLRALISCTIILILLAVVTSILIWGLSRFQRQ
ncbi:MAG: zf-HC2 domain-containing protein [Lachnospiraceae bacterium]|nr:zf-HC2 domain-containing protein [Lachnospiraceae bacterium]